MAVENQDIIRITANMEYAGNTIQNVYHGRYSGPTEDDAVVETALKNSMDALYNNIKSHYPTDFDFVSIGIWNVTQDRPMTEDVWPSLTSGTGAGDMGATQLAPMVLFGTDTARSQGRKFLPPVIGTLVEEAGDLAPIVVVNTALYIAAALVDIAIGSGTFAYGNWSPTKLRFAEWTTGLIRSIVRTQRRRVRGVGS